MHADRETERLTYHSAIEGLKDWAHALDAVRARYRGMNDAIWTPR